MKPRSMAVCLLLLSASAGAAELITTAEAALPAPADNGVLTRAITRGPAIQLVSPPQAAVGIQSPFDLRVEFTPRGTAKIVADTVKVTYDRLQPVDLTERVRAGVSDKGIVLSGARVPAGKHTLVVTVADSEGRRTTRAFELMVLSR
jgi:hypothetical protein